MKKTYVLLLLLCLLVPSIIFSKFQASQLTDEELSKQDAYMVPTWPFHASAFEEKDKIDIKASYEHAGNAFSSGGHTQDLSKLVFGECPIYVRDILLVSKLVENGDVDDYSNCEELGGYLGGVAGQRLCFDAEIDEFRLEFSYVRHFLDNDVSLGIVIPFVWKKHSLTLSTSVSQVARENECFQESYGCDFNAFICDILRKKGSVLTTKDEERGLGDIEMFLNYEIPCRHFEWLLVGAKLHLPTARERNLHKLWDPELGNGGFTEISAFCSGLIQKYRCFNPHFLIEGIYGCSADVPRRIPSCKSYTETRQGGMRALGDILAMGELVRTKTDTDFSCVDTIFRRFATESERIRIRRGISAAIRVGNIFDRVIFNRGFLDIYYNFRIKGSDYISEDFSDCACNIGGCQVTTLFIPTILKHNTYQLEHRVGINFSYQFDDHVRTAWGAEYTFAGRNIEKRFGLNGMVTVEF